MVIELEQLEAHSCVALDIRALAKEFERVRLETPGRQLADRVVDLSERCLRVHRGSLPFAIIPDSKCAIINTRS